MHVSIPATYSSSGISIARLSPFRTGCGSCDEGISHLFDTALAKVFGCFRAVIGDDLFESGLDVSPWSFFHGVSVDFLIVLGWEEFRVRVIGFEGSDEIFGGLLVGSS